MPPIRLLNRGHLTLAFASASGKFARLKFWQAVIHGRFPLAILAGVVWALAFPKPGLAGLAWIAPALLCLSAAGRKAWSAWRMGYLGGLTFYLVSLRWLLFIPMTGAPIIGWLALSAYMAIYPATWTWLCWRLFPAPLERSGDGGEWMEALSRLSWARRSSWALVGAAAWTALEYLSSNLLTGFPWNLLGVSQYRMTPLIQLAASTGIWGLSFLIVWFSISLLCAGSVALVKRRTLTAWLPEVILPITAALATFGVGFQLIITAPVQERRTLTAVLVQPSIPQTMIWNPRENERRFEALIRLTREALTNQPDLLIWPESAVPKMVRYDAPTAQAVSDLARTNQVWLILNSDDAEPRAGREEPDFFNAAFLINRQGELAAKYHKQRLVMFGEYVPFVRWLPFLKSLAPIEDYAAGTRPVPFDLTDLSVRASVLICFEDMFPQSARKAVDAETDFLVNLTNDGWFKEGSEQWQQAAAAVFRAVENRRPLIRCTNNGLTCWVDEFGRIRQRLDATARGIYGEGFLVAKIDLPSRESRGPDSLYRRFGDWFAWSCAVLTLAGLGSSLRPRRENEPN